MNRPKEYAVFIKEDGRGNFKIVEARRLRKLNQNASVVDVIRSRDLARAIRNGKVVAS